MVCAIVSDDTICGDDSMAVHLKAAEDAEEEKRDEGPWQKPAVAANGGSQSCSSEASFTEQQPAEGDCAGVYAETKLPSNKPAF